MANIRAIILLMQWRSYVFVLVFLVKKTSLPPPTDLLLQNDLSAKHNTNKKLVTVINGTIYENF